MPRQRTAAGRLARRQSVPVSESEKALRVPDRLAGRMRALCGVVLQTNLGQSIHLLDVVGHSRGCRRAVSIAKARAIARSVLVGSGIITV